MNFEACHIVIAEKMFNLYVYCIYMYMYIVCWLAVTIFLGWFFFKRLEGDLFYFEVSQ